MGKKEIKGNEKMKGKKKKKKAVERNVRGLGGEVKGKSERRGRWSRGGRVGGGGGKGWVSG